jgi:hypothetical protein
MGKGSFILFGAVMGVDVWELGYMCIEFLQFYVLKIHFQCTPLEHREKMTHCQAIAWARVTVCAHNEVEIILRFIMLTD